ncbi:MAG: His/Gly/Thr/Pro-type tRNA ligase C-terminal domain-containing protein, partial [Anaerolineales bacterium]
ALVGEVRPATEEEIRAAGAVPGYASPIGLRQGRVLVDAWIPLSPNLVAGANEEDYHLKNVNYGRDYVAHQVAELIWAEAGALCPKQDDKLEALTVLPLQVDGNLLEENLLRALAETHHDAAGLRWSPLIAPFDIYLLDVPGKEMDTRAVAAELYEQFTSAGLEVLFDDRDERAGLKFTDADLLGIPWRITVGERALKEGHLEVKDRVNGAVLRLPIQEALQFFAKWKLERELPFLDERSL